MLREFPFADLLFSPMVICVALGLMLTVATRALVPARLLQTVVWKRSWLNLSLFVCYLAGSMALLDGVS
ncbi:DUF1656 domain-containing protein [Stutzerimonas nitrititolerans]|uniref:DUF1656 domain-containing protein n=1 Tax=Stutzerimonas nitrititolerans TaxID=2482751 RepID=UPI0028B07EA1|nr:DUF1656 domain-containing protein [Stutzerimonas nitrititolerans]